MPQERTIIDLNGDWQTTWREFHQGEFPSTNTRKTANAWCKEKADWIPARVPGDVHDDAFRAGLIPEPYLADNAEQCTWVTEKEWWYKKEFVAPPDQYERCELIFKGIDTFARVYLNGILLGRTDNMLLEWRFDVKDALRLGESNDLMIVIEPIRTHLNAVYSEGYYGTFNTERIFLRKAQCHFGWDWGPDCPGTGIYDEVRLEMGSSTRVESLNIKSRLNGEVTFFVDLKANIDTFRGVDLDLEVFSPDGSVATQHTWRTKDIKSFVNLKIDSPELWWPNGKGEFPLYEYRLRLTQGEGGVCAGRVSGAFWHSRGGLGRRTRGPTPNGFRV